MTDRERLTKHWGNNCVATKLNYDFLLTLPNIEVKNFNAIIQKLAHYEDLEEQGKIIVLPCKVGDKIYYIDRYSNEVEEDVIKYFTVTQNGVKPILTGHNKKFWDMYEWGKTVFLTREEAEKALAERQTP